MREIKFRFYYKNKLIDELTLKELAIKCDFHWAEDVIVVQFIGLHDKNGKEIYEGDILATSNDGKDGCDIWDIKTFGYTKVIWDIASSRFRGTKWTWGVGEIDSVYDLNYVEVIGDIYENLKLLKEVK